MVKLRVGFAAILLAVFLMACGGGGGDSSNSGTPTGTETGFVKGMGWYFDNAAPDYSGNGATCLLNVRISYDKSITAEDIESFIVTAPNGWQWTIASSSSHFGSTSSGEPFIGGTLFYGENPQAFPLAGLWTAAIKLKNGKTSSLQHTLHEPGSSSDAIHQYLYTKEDWIPSVNPSQYMAALGRFPSQGYTVQYSAIDGGKITTTGLSQIRATFLAAEPAAYNMYCWLYDANREYLGHSSTEYSLTDHSSTDLIAANGELLIVPALTTASTGNVDLSTVKYIRFVYVDGAQYEPSSHSTIDYRSISSFVEVN